MKEPNDSVFYMKTMWLMHNHPRAPGWYFWDETRSKERGPFNTEKECRAELATYIKHLDGSDGSQDRQ